LVVRPGLVLEELGHSGPKLRSPRERDREGDWLQRQGRPFEVRHLGSDQLAAFFGASFDAACFRH
jgi:hypothetical protein